MHHISLLIFVSSFLLAAAHSYGQVSTSLFCENGNTSVAVNFRGQQAELSMQKFLYKLRYDGAYIGDTGIRYSIYINQEIRVSTAYPNDPASVMVLARGVEERMIFAGLCTKLNTAKSLNNKPNK